MLMKPVEVKRWPLRACRVGITQSNGTFTAPSTGIEGWFWDNESGDEVTVKLVTAGFYDYILQNRDDIPQGS